jgi:hypothetical protein
MFSPVVCGLHIGAGTVFTDEAAGAHRIRDVLQGQAGEQMPQPGLAVQ